MKYILTILLGCLMYSAQGQIKESIVPVHTLSAGWTKAPKWDTVYIHGRRMIADTAAMINDLDEYLWCIFWQQKELDSLTHAFQTAHDSLIELEKERRPLTPCFSNSAFVTSANRYLLRDSIMTYWTAPKKKRRKG